MDKESLLNSAKQLKQPSAAAANEFSAKREAITITIKHVLDARTDLLENEKAQNSGMDRNNHTYHMKHMEGLFMAYSPEEYVETTLWTARMYGSHGFNILYWKEILTVIVSVLKSQLTENTFQEIYPFYEWMISNIPEFIELGNPKTQR